MDAHASSKNRSDTTLPANYLDKSTETTRSQATPISKYHIWVMAIACGLSVANLYYIQPLLAAMQHSFAVSVDQIGFIATLSQLGYASGLLLIVPLGDKYNQRTLIVSMLCAVAAALILMATASTISMLAIASYAIGLTTIIPQLIVPFAAGLAQPHERGHIVGTVMSGLLVGVLLARMVSGFVGAHFGWQMMYWIAAAIMIALAITLRILLPTDHSTKKEMSYPQLLHSLWGLITSEQVLQETCILGALVFGTFSLFWVSLPFMLETPPYHYGSDVIGLLSLVGIAGALAALFVGKFADRRDARYANGFGLIVVLLSFILMWFTGQWIIGLVIGAVLLDLGAQSNQIANQSRIYSTNPAARNRLNTIYMFIFFIGGSLGSFLGTFGWSIAKWNGVCGIACLMLIIAITFYIFNGKHLRQQKEHAPN